MKCTSCQLAFSPSGVPVLQPGMPVRRTPFSMIPAFGNRLGRRGHRIEQRLVAGRCHPPAQEQGALCFDPGWLAARVDAASAERHERAADQQHEHDQHHREDATPPSSLFGHNAAERSARLALESAISYQRSAYLSCRKPKADR